jgi:hypothetical protein
VEGQLAIAHQIPLVATMRPKDMHHSRIGVRGHSPPRRSAIRLRMRGTDPGLQCVCFQQLEAS